MDFINKEHSRNKLSNAVVDVLVDDLINFVSKLLSDLCFLASAH